MALKLEFLKEEKYHSIKLEINSVFNILNSDMDDKFNFTVLAFTKSLESISSIYINEFTMRYIYDDSCVGIYNHNKNVIENFNNEKWYKSIENRLHNIMHEELEIEDKTMHKNLCELINCRNYMAHPNGREPNGCSLIKNPDENNILIWFQMLNTIFSSVNRTI